MGFIEKRSGRYRARYRDPLGRQRSETLTRKADAERFLREMQVDIERGRWIDPAGADVALAPWATEFLSLARRLSPSTQETYARDLKRYVLPRFGSYRIGRLPADEIENWLNDEIAAGIAPSSVHRHYRTLRRVLQVAVEKEKLLANPCDRVQPPRVPTREMVFLTWEDAVDLAEAINERYRALIYLAVDSGMRWSELVGLRRAKVDLNRGKVRVTEQLIRLESGEWLRKEPKTSAGTRSITISSETHHPHQQLMKRGVSSIGWPVADVAARVERQFLDDRRGVCGHAPVELQDGAPRLFCSGPHVRELGRIELRHALRHRPVEARSEIVPLDHGDVLDDAQQVRARRRQWPTDVIIG